MVAPIPEKTHRVMIVDDDDRIRSALARLLGLWPGYEVVGMRDTADDLPSEVDRLRPDVVLLDLDMPGVSPVAAIENLHSGDQEAKVLVVSGLGDGPSVRACLGAGAEGFVLKDDGPEAIHEGLEAVLVGGHYLSRGLADVTGPPNRI